MRPVKNNFKMNSSGTLDYFYTLKKRDSLGTSYLFVGDNQSLVYDIIKLISCCNDAHPCDSCWDCLMIDKRKHPNMHIVKPEYLTTTIDAVHQGIRFLTLKGFGLGKKILIIEDGDSLNKEAASAFLKTLEEPPKNSFIAICVSKIEGVLPTIISRCRKIFFPSSAADIDVSSAGAVGDFLRGDEVGFSDRKQFISFLWTFILLLHGSLVSRISGQNNQLPAGFEYEIILGQKSPQQIQNALNGALTMYGARKSVNINLALNLIRMKL